MFVMNLKTLFTMKILREINKLIMFVILWSVPMVTARLFDSANYLWLFIVSVVFSIAVFSHYEDLEKIDSINSFRLSDDEREQED